MIVNSAIQGFQPRPSHTSLSSNAYGVLHVVTAQGCNIANPYC